MKKICVVIFEGFSDLDVSSALSRMMKMDDSPVKVIAPTMDPVKAKSGIRMIPDSDYFVSDLDDMDASNTALVILPGGEFWKDGGARFASLVRHCMVENIPLTAMGEAATYVAGMKYAVVGERELLVRTDQRIVQLKEVTI